MSNYLMHQTGIDSTLFLIIMRETCAKNNNTFLKSIETISFHLKKEKKRKTNFELNFKYMQWPIGAEMMALRVKIIFFFHFCV